MVASTFDSVTDAELSDARVSKVGPCSSAGTHWVVYINGDVVDGEIGTTSTIAGYCTISWDQEYLNAL